ncbi:MAG: hypothetical protein M0Q12_00065 [Synergistaceae bacterium]|jgi:hypothetical protein|nr:hypothetical protein [Synergistaceae bacterium]
MSQSIRSTNMIRIIRHEIKSYLMELHTSLPGEIVQYDASKKIARVKAHFKTTLPNGSTESLAELVNVPVKFPQTHGFIFEWALIHGDLVEISCSEQSLDTWIQQGSEVDTLDTRRHDLSDATCAPTFNIGSQKAAADPLDPTSLNVRIARIDDPGCAIKLKPDGTVVLETPTAVKLFAETSSSSPLPQEAFHTWLQALFAKILVFLPKLGSIKVGGVPADATFPADVVQLISDLTDLLNQFVQDAPPPGGTGIGYGCKSTGVYIP